MTATSKLNDRLKTLLDIFKRNGFEVYYGWDPDLDTWAEVRKDGRVVSATARLNEVEDCLEFLAKKLGLIESP